MSKQLNRKVLKVNNRTSIKQHFQYVEPFVKSVANPSIMTWSNPGKGVEGESVNSTSTNDSQIINKNWRPI
jgi:hypothetical protein